MIAVLSTGNGFKGTIRYDLRAGLSLEEDFVNVIDASGVSYDYDKNGKIIVDPKQVAFDLRQQTMGYTGKGCIKKPVYHWALSYHPDDKVSEEQMLKDAKDFLRRIGFDDTQYVITVHYDKKHHHLHIITNVIDNQGRRIPTMGLIDKAHKVAAAITKERGYIWGEKMKPENITKEKIHKPRDRARETMELMIREALAKSTSLENFQKTLNDEYNISCWFTRAADGKRGKMSFCYEYEGRPQPFYGSAISKDLSFGCVNEVILRNKLTKEKRDNFWEDYSSKYYPMYSELKAACDSSFSMYNFAKVQYGNCSQTISERYAQLKVVYSEMETKHKAVVDAKTAKELVGAASAFVFFLNPIAGLVIGLVGSVLAEAAIKSGDAAYGELRTRAAGIRDSIDGLKKKQSALRQDKADMLKIYVEDKEAKSELQREIDGLKEALNASVRKETVEKAVSGAAVAIPETKSTVAEKVREIELPPKQKEDERKSIDDKTRKYSAGDADNYVHVNGYVGEIVIKRIGDVNKMGIFLNVKTYENDEVGGDKTSHNVSIVTENAEIINAFTEKAAVLARNKANKTIDGDHYKSGYEPERVTISCDGKLAIRETTTVDKDGKEVTFNRMLIVANPKSIVLGNKIDKLEGETMNKAVFKGNIAKISKYDDMAVIRIATHYYAPEGTEGGKPVEIKKKNGETVNLTEMTSFIDTRLSGKRFPEMFEKFGKDIKEGDLVSVSGQIHNCENSSNVIDLNSLEIISKKKSETEENKAEQKAARGEPVKARNHKSRLTM